MKVEIENYKSRYSEDTVIDTVCNGAIDALTKMSVNAIITVSPNWISNGIKS